MATVIYVSYYYYCSYFGLGMSMYPSNTLSTLATWQTPTIPQYCFEHCLPSISIGKVFLQQMSNLDNSLTQSTVLII